ncbi:hypothetical protein HDV05_007915, partial [Chytridiales sp. JEL 0842]
AAKLMGATSTPSPPQAFFHGSTESLVRVREPIRITPSKNRIAEVAGVLKSTSNTERFHSLNKNSTPLPTSSSSSISPPLTSTTSSSRLLQNLQPLNTSTPTTPPPSISPTTSTISSTPSTPSYPPSTRLTNPFLKRKPSKPRLNRPRAPSSIYMETAARNRASIASSSTPVSPRWRSSRASGFSASGGKRGTRGSLQGQGGGGGVGVGGLSPIQASLAGSGRPKIGGRGASFGTTGSGKGKKNSAVVGVKKQDSFDFADAFGGGGEEEEDGEEMVMRTYTLEDGFGV